MKISNKTGSAVSGDDFFDREWEFEQLLNAIQASDSVLISAPRRVGKSSIMKKALAWAKSENWSSIEIDVQECRTEADFLENFVAAFTASGIKSSTLQKLADKVTNFKKWLAGTSLKGPGGFGVEIGEHIPSYAGWEEATKAIEQILHEESAQDRRVLIGLDELPIFLARLLKNDPKGGVVRIDTILHWLRALRQRHVESIVWIFCGSVGLDTFVQQHNLAGSINDLQLQTLGAFSEKKAREFLQSLAASPQNQLDLPAETVDAILDRVGWPLPYFLQLMFHAIRQVHPDERTKEYPAVADVDAAVELLLSATYSKNFIHWITRLRDQLAPQDADAAELMLKNLCRKSKGLSRNKCYALLLARRPEADPEAIEKQCGFLLDMLERDGYLQRNHSIYHFRSFLLREFWRRRT